MFEDSMPGYLLQFAHYSIRQEDPGLHPFVNVTSY